MQTHVINYVLKNSLVYPNITNNFMKQEFHKILLSYRIGMIYFLFYFVLTISYSMS